MNAGINSLIHLHNRFNQIGDRSVLIDNGMITTDHSAILGKYGHLLEQKFKGTRTSIVNLTKKCFQTGGIEDEYIDISSQLPTNKPITGRAVCKILNGVINQLNQKEQLQNLKKKIDFIRYDITTKVIETIQPEDLTLLDITSTEDNLKKFRQILSKKLEVKCLHNPDIYFPTDEDVAEIWQEISQKVKHNHNLINSQPDLTDSDKRAIINSTATTPKLMTAAIATALCTSIDGAKKFVIVAMTSDNSQDEISIALHHFQQVLNSIIYLPGKIGYYNDSFSSADDVDSFMTLTITAAIQSLFDEANTFCINPSLMRSMTSPTGSFSKFITWIEQGNTVQPHPQIDTTNHVTDGSTPKYVDQLQHIQRIKIVNKTLSAALAFEA